MSWLFGSKKKPVRVTEEEPIETETPEGYLRVSRVPPIAIQDPTDFDQDAPTPIDATEGGDAVGRRTIEDVGYLTGVPFKLCKRLETNLNSTFETELIRIEEILEYIRYLENAKLDYDFAVEQSIVAEMNSGAEQ